MVSIQQSSNDSTMAGLRCRTRVWLLVCWVAGLSHAHITLESSSASVRLAAPRFPHHPLHLQVDAFNQQHKLTLKPAPSPFAPNFKLQTTTRDHQGRLLLQEVEDTDNERSTIYHDPDTGAVVSVDGSSVEGLLTPTLSIKPSADGGHQAIRHQPVDSARDIYDYIELPHHLRFNQENLVVPQGEVSITPELYVVVDSALASAIGSDAKVKEYLGIFYNSVNRRFASIKDPKTQMILAGAVIIRNKDDEPFITKNVYSDNYINSDKSLSDVAIWLYSKKDGLPAYDLAYLMTGMNIARKSGDTIDGDIVGLAYYGAACIEDTKRKMSVKTAMGEDRGAFYYGVYTAAHELAHNLGVPHDGEQSTQACPWDDGYIMSYVGGTVNSPFFSKCSGEIMKAYASSSQGACLKSISVGEKIPISSTLPGEILSMDEQCKKATGRDNAYAASNATDNQLCRQLDCHWVETNSKGTFVSGMGFLDPAADGTPCRHGGVCTDGTCK